MNGPYSTSVKNEFVNTLMRTVRILSDLCVYLVRRPVRGNLLAAMAMANGDILIIPSLRPGLSGTRQASHPNEDKDS